MPSWKRKVASWLRRCASWLEGPPHSKVERAALALVREAERMAAGTSGEYKRAWAYGRLLKTLPTTPKHEIGLAIELAVTRLHGA